MTSESSMYEAGHPKWVLWEDLEGQSREGGRGAGSGWRVHMHTVADSR